MAEAIIYTVFAIFAVYGMYTAARETVLFVSHLTGKKEDTRHLCHGCKGCSVGELAKGEDTCVPDLAPTEADENDEDNDFFRT